MQHHKQVLAPPLVQGPHSCNDKPCHRRCNGSHHQLPRLQKFPSHTPRVREEIKPSPQAPPCGQVQPQDDVDSSQVCAQRIDKPGREPRLVKLACQCILTRVLNIGTAEWEAAAGGGAKGCLGACFYTGGLCWEGDHGCTCDPSSGAAAGGTHIRAHVRLCQRPLSLSLWSLCAGGTAGP